MKLIVGISIGEALCKIAVLAVIAFAVFERGWSAWWFLLIPFL